MVKLARLFTQTSSRTLVLTKTKEFNLMLSQRRGVCKIETPLQVVSLAQLEMSYYYFLTCFNQSLTNHISKTRLIKQGACLKVKEMLLNLTVPSWLTRKKENFLLNVVPRVT